MAATFSRIKNWAAETLTNVDLNAEIDNILNNLGPVGIGDYSTNVTQMRLEVSPGAVGAESLATSLAGEVERLRYVLKDIKGTDAQYWYDETPISLTEINTVVFGGGGLPQSRIESGRTTGNSALLNVIEPAGTANSFIIRAATTDLIYYVSGERYVLDEDVTVSGLLTAPSSDNTTTVRDPSVTDEHYTTYLGEHGTALLLASPSGTNFVSGNTGVFYVNNGSATEYFSGTYEVDLFAGACIKDARRGQYFNSAGNAVPRIAFSFGDTVTLLRAAYVFIKSDKTATITYNLPTYSADEPASPSIGDYWFDFTETIWKVYTPSGWVDSLAVYLGHVVVTSANCVAARTVEPYRIFSALNNMDINCDSPTVFVPGLAPSISVYGKLLQYGQNSIVLDVPGSSAGTYYYFYVKETGECALDTQAPHDRKSDLGGMYHPTESWRCIGHLIESGGSFIERTIVAFSRSGERSFHSNDSAPVGHITNVVKTDGTAPFQFLPRGYLETDGGTISRGLYYSLLNDNINDHALGFGVGLGDTSETFDLPNMRNINTDLISVVSTSTWTTNTSITTFAARRGNNLYARIKLTVSGAPNATQLFINLPADCTIDTAKYGTALNNALVTVGEAWIVDLGTRAYKSDILLDQATPTRLIANLIGVSGSTLLNGSITATNPMTWASGDNFTGWYEVPLTEDSWNDSNSLGNMRFPGRTVIKALK